MNKIVTDYTTDLIFHYAALQNTFDEHALREDLESFGIYVGKNRIKARWNILMIDLLSNIIPKVRTIYENDLDDDFDSESLPSSIEEPAQTSRLNQCLYDAVAELADDSVSECSGCPTPPPIELNSRKILELMKKHEQVSKRPSTPRFPKPKVTPEPIRIRRNRALN